MPEKNILVVGDIHGEWAYLASLLLYYRPDVCIATGDFGWWPGWGELPQDVLPEEILLRTEIRFVDGNHENHESLLEMVPRGCFEAFKVAPGIIYQPRGSTLTLPDGRSVFFAGGAKSIDWKFRKRGKTWFKEELLLRKHLPEKLPLADIVVSHTVPNAFGEDKLEGCCVSEPFDFTPDISQETLDAVLEGCRPSLWLAGHYHRRIDGRYRDTEYHVLDMIQSGLCRPNGIPGIFWLSGGPGVQRKRSGWAMPDDVFLPLVESASGLYACANMTALPPTLHAVFQKRRCMYRTLKVDNVKGIIPRAADSFVKTLYRLHWDPEAALKDRNRDPA